MDTTSKIIAGAAGVVFVFGSVYFYGKGNKQTASDTLQGGSVDNLVPNSMSFSAPIDDAGLARVAAAGWKPIGAVTLPTQTSNGEAFAVFKKGTTCAIFGYMPGAAGSNAVLRLARANVSCGSVVQPEQGQIFPVDQPAPYHPAGGVSAYGGFNPTAVPTASPGPTMSGGGYGGANAPLPPPSAFGVPLADLDALALHPSLAALSGIIRSVLNTTEKYLGPGVRDVVVPNSVASLGNSLAFTIAPMDNRLSFTSFSDPANAPHVAKYIREDLVAPLLGSPDYHRITDGLDLVADLLG